MTFRFGAFALDLAQRQLQRGGADVRLTPMAFNLLACLVHDAPRVVPKQELHGRLWPDTFVSDATLVGLIKELRRALEDRESRTTIRTVHGVGYAFAAPVERPEPLPARVKHWLRLGGKRLLLKPGPNLIGRDPDAGVWLDFASVSRRHARIVITDREARLEDLGSKNGTTVRERHVADATMLHDGDRIAVGTVTLIYRTSGVGPTTETHIRSAPA